MCDARTASRLTSVAAAPFSRGPAFTQHGERIDATELSASRPHSTSGRAIFIGRPSDRASSRTCCAGGPAATATRCYLRNLLPAYRALEQGLERHRLTPGVGALAQPALYRAQALEADLAGSGRPGLARCGAAACPRASAMRAGSTPLRKATAARLIGHAYTRYLGDLSGGQILGRLLAKLPGARASDAVLLRFSGDRRRRGLQGRTIAVDWTRAADESRRRRRSCSTRRPWRSSSTSICRRRSRRPWRRG